MKCDVTHSHIKKTPEGEEEDSEIGSDVSLPFHLRMLMKTEFLYKEISMFMDHKDVSVHLLQCFYFVILIILLDETLEFLRNEHI
jgi:hypothetical protein